MTIIILALGLELIRQASSEDPRVYILALLVSGIVISFRDFLIENRSKLDE